MAANGSIEAEMRRNVAVANAAANELAQKILAEAQSCEALRIRLADAEAAKAAAEERVGGI